MALSINLQQLSLRSLHRLVLLLHPLQIFKGHGNEKLLGVPAHQFKPFLRETRIIKLLGLNLQGLTDRLTLKCLQDDRSHLRSSLFRGELDPRYNLDFHVCVINIKDLALVGLAVLIAQNLVDLLGLQVVAAMNQERLDYWHEYEIQKLLHEVLQPLRNVALEGLNSGAGTQRLRRHVGAAFGPDPAIRSLLAGL